MTPYVPPFSKVAHIRLEECNSLHGFRRWIDYCKALKSFDFTIQPIEASTCPGNSNIVPNLRFLWQSLLLHKTTLEAVRICPPVGNVYRHNPQWSSIVNRTGSFIEFQALKYLYISLPMLAGEKYGTRPGDNLRALLPSSLQILFLRDCEVCCYAPVRICDELTELLRSNYLPHLTHLAIDGFYSRNRDPVDRMNETLARTTLRDRCFDAGIKFSDDLLGLEGEKSNDVESFWPRF
jgi:hypothetical protein